MYNEGMVSESWESLNTGLATRLSMSVTYITLFFGMMLANYDQILKDAQKRDCWIH